MHFGKGVEGETLVEVDDKLGRSDQSWETAYLRAHLARRQKAWGKAAEAYGLLLERLSENGDPYLGATLEARIASGTVRLKVGELDGALEDFTAASVLQPRGIEPVLFLARTYYRKDRQGMAEKHLLSLHKSTEFKNEAAAKIS